jgi:hypothetical protein
MYIIGQSISFYTGLRRLYNANFTIQQDRPVTRINVGCSTQGCGQQKISRSFVTSISSLHPCSSSSRVRVRNVSSRLRRNSPNTHRRSFVPDEAQLASVHFTMTASNPPVLHVLSPQTSQLSGCFSDPLDCGFFKVMPFADDIA